ncbi:MAG: radical SAM protein [Bacteroidales bacterium]|jgi:uncharacterized protein|nr:radical SAM protein [Bacteroidales bacterium]
MKYSQYNTFISLTEQVSALYNALSDKFVLLTKIIFNDLNLPIHSLAKKNSTLYEELLQAKAIVENNIDEYEYIKNFSREIDNNSKEYKLMLNPTLDCNLKCWYCYENHIKGSRMSAITIASIKKNITNIFQKYKKLEAFYLYFFGGEPLLAFSTAKELISCIADHCNKQNIILNISFTSNGVLINERNIIYLKQKCKKVSFQITLDGGELEHDKVRFLTSKAGTYKRILKNIHLLLKHEVFVILRINYTKENILSISSILSDIQEWDDNYKGNMKIDFQRVWQEDKNALNIDEFIESFTNTGFLVTSPIHNVDNVRFPCYADNLNQLLINYNGDVFKCTARDFATENRCGYLTETGNIIWTSLPPDERLETKMQKSICRTCSILPLCGGGCSQRCIEQNDEEHCTYNYEEADKKEIVLNRFYNYFVKNYETNTGI